jgi:hypothetical protein
MVLVSAGVAPAWSLVFNAGIVLAALLFERRGYQPKAPNPSVLRPTGERFQDPTSGQIIEVWEDPATGLREYRPVSDPPRLSS